MMLDEKTQEKALAALSRIEGQVRGIAKMVTARRYCIDILTQTGAAEAALHRVGETVLQKHMETCVMEAFRSGSKKESREKIQELMSVYGRCRIR
jgi:DNA-binding FrmR family transcriptional regulator